MNIYVTLLGRSGWALLNTYYAAVDGGYTADTVHVFAEEAYKDMVGEIERGLGIISEGYGFSPDIKTHVVEGADFAEVAGEFRETLQTMIEEGNEVSIDITPGRKILVAAALLSAFELSSRGGLNVHRVLYLAVTETQPRPYYEIPFQFQELRNLLDDIEGADARGR
jgi:hypothetical protein